MQNMVVKVANWVNEDDAVNANQENGRFGYSCRIFNLILDLYVNNYML